jgi:DNA-binding FrmR family transcriptional regulator
MVQLDPQDMKPVINRLKRAQGQLAAVVRMLEEGQDCQQVVQQLSAASKAVDRAGFAIISSGMQQCLTADADPADREADREAMEKLFLSLA